MEDRKAETGGGGNHNKVFILLREKYVSIDCLAIVRKIYI